MCIDSRSERRQNHSCSLVTQKKSMAALPAMTHSLRQPSLETDLRGEPVIRRLPSLIVLATTGSSRGRRLVVFAHQVGFIREGILERAIRTAITPPVARNALRHLLHRRRSQLMTFPQMRGQGDIRLQWLIAHRASR
jgi:hypothetical protein